MECICFKCRDFMKCVDDDARVEKCDKLKLSLSLPRSRHAGYKYGACGEVRLGEARSGAARIGLARKRVVRGVKPAQTYPAKDEV